jgi:YidC/Oxa1 family membrane protein insertase
VNDRRLLAALALIMVIAFVPTFILKRQAPPSLVAAAQRDTLSPPVAAAPVVSVPDGTARPDSASGSLVHEDTVVVRSKLYRYGISTRGGRIISSRFLHYRSLAVGDHRDTLELLPPGEGLLDGTVIAGGDTLRFDQIAFTASADSLNTTTGPATLSLHGASGTYRVDLAYGFSPVDYRVNVTGRVTGLGPAGGTLLIGLGNGFRATEASMADNWGQSGVVTKFEKTSVTLFSRFKPRQVTTMSGPFEWVAVKSKYFVAGLFAYDSSASQGVKGKIGGVQAFAADTASRPIRAQVAASLAVPADGAFQWSLYLGPMEYDRLSHMGRDFDDVNPYGWAWLRPIIRPIAVVIRTIFVWMHTALGLGYGLVIVMFGLLVRILLWPLSRIAMRSMARMQAVQPELTALQAKYKDNPQLLQQETFKLYKQRQVNPFGGCWPMLLPYPVLVAVFFVLAYTIEVRGVSFLWMPDLARADPLYLIPILMAGSMFAVSKIGQMGLPPNPQTKMMTWMMPAMMLVFFARFAAGLNLYYAVQNLASIPQQWLVVKERMQMQGKLSAPGAAERKKA